MTMTSWNGGNSYYISILTLGSSLFLYFDLPGVKIIKINLLAPAPSYLECWPLMIKCLNLNSDSLCHSINEIMGFQQPTTKEANWYKLVLLPSLLPLDCRPPPIESSTVSTKLIWPVTAHLNSYLVTTGWGVIKKFNIAICWQCGAGFQSKIPARVFCLAALLIQWEPHLETPRLTSWWVKFSCHSCEKR